MTHVADLEGHQIEAPELAIDAVVEEHKFTNSVFQLRTHMERPDVFELMNRAFCPAILPLFQGSR